MAAARAQQVDVTSLDVPQLLDVRKQLELELEQFTTMFGQLKVAQARFSSCIESLDAVKPENQGAQRENLTCFRKNIAHSADGVTICARQTE